MYKKAISFYWNRFADFQFDFNFFGRRKEREDVFQILLVLQKRRKKIVVIDCRD